MTLIKCKIRPLAVPGPSPCLEAQNSCTVIKEPSFKISEDIYSGCLGICFELTYSILHISDDAYISRQELKEFKENSSCHHVLANNSESILDSKSFSLAKGRILFQPNTVLDRDAVSVIPCTKARLP